jgi:hypothetical protein
MSPKHHHEVSLPLLRMLADGRVKTVQALLKELFVRHTPKSKKGLRQNSSSLLASQVFEARACLEHACLVQRLSRRRCRITPQGWKVLQCKTQAQKLCKGGSCVSKNHHPIPNSMNKRTQSSNCVERQAFFFFPI